MELLIYKNKSELKFEELWKTKSKIKEYAKEQKLKKCFYSFSKKFKQFLDRIV